MPRTANLDLTQEEVHVLNYVADGETMDEIAYRMGKTTRAVEHHCNMIRRKLNATNLPQAVKIGLQRGIIL
jgi:DNA-binding CsgD family transcriptional regulator